MVTRKTPNSANVEGMLPLQKKRTPLLARRLHSVTSLLRAEVAKEADSVAPVGFRKLRGEVECAIRSPVELFFSWFDPNHQGWEPIELVIPLSLYSVDCSAPRFLSLSLSCLRPSITARKLGRDQRNDPFGRDLPWKREREKALGSLLGCGCFFFSVKL